MNSRALTTWVVTLLAFASMGLFIAKRLELSTGLDHFLSETSDLNLAAISSQQMNSRTVRSMVLLVRGPDLPAALDATRQWGERLAQHAEVEAVQLGPDPALRDAVYDLYFPRRYSLFSHEFEAGLPELVTAHGLERAAKRLREELVAPRAPLIKEIANADPLLAFPDLLERFLEQGQGRLQIVNGQFAAPEARAGVILLTTRHSAFASNYQAPLQDFIRESFAELQAQSSGSFALERSGVHRFAVASERQGIAESQRISTISLIGIALLFMVLFRSPRLLAAAILPLASGVLVATCVSILIFDQFHLMTLVFGSTLIGVCVDYPIHYICHHTLLPDPGGPSGSLRRVWPAIAMGALTTMAGFGGLAWSDFPGIRELGVFAAVGVLAALTATRTILPNLLPATPTPSATARRAAELLSRGLDSLRRSRLRLRATLAAALLLVCVGAPFVAWEDDVFSLNLPINTAWAEEDRSVRHWLSQMDLGRFVVAIADDEEQALARNDEVYARLSDARSRGLLEDFRSLAVFLPSASHQERSSARFRSVPDLERKTLDALEAAGFRPEAFGAYREALAEGPPPALRFADLNATPLARLVEPFRVDFDGHVGLLTFLKGVADPEELEAALAGLDGVTYFEQQSFIAELYGRYRARVTLLVVAGLVAVGALLFGRFRSIRDTIAILAPAVSAAAATLAILSLSGTSINLLHLLGLLLVLSIGVDYSIFLVSSHRSDESQAATMLSLCLACASTCLSFGLLSLSDFPALQALGITTGLGTLLSLVLAPSVLTLLEDRAATT